MKMEREATREIELAKGVVLTVKAVYVYDHEDGDVMADKATHHIEYTKVVYSININGKVLQGGQLRKSLNKDFDYEIMFKDTKIGLKPETAERVLTAEKEAMAEVEPVEFAEKKAEAEKAEAEKEIAEIEMKIAEIEKSNNIFETEAEANAERERLNELYNEGGDGFLPKVYSVEYLNTLKNKINRCRKDSGLRTFCRKNDAGSSK